MARPVVRGVRIPRAAAVTAARDVGWRDTPFTPNIHPFTSHPGMNVPPPDTALGFFQLFFTRELLEYLAKETNRYANQRINGNPVERARWVPTNIIELAKFLGLSMLMGVIRLPRLVMYWATSHLFRIPIFTETMSRQRYQDIPKVLSCIQ